MPIALSIWYNYRVDTSFVRAWLLLAVPETPEPLWVTLMWADWMWRTVPSGNELREGLGWLVSAGLVGTDGKRFWLTQHGKSLVEECGGKRGSVFRAIDRVRRRLEQVHLDEWQPLPLTDEEAHKAYREYTREFWRMERERRANRARVLRAAVFLVVREKPAELWEILAAGDMIDQNPLLYDEVRETLGWLISAGLIQEVAGKFALTEQGYRLWQECQRDSSTTTLTEAREWLEQRLSEMNVDKWRRYPLTGEQYQTAHMFLFVKKGRG